MDSTYLITFGNDYSHIKDLSEGLAAIIGIGKKPENNFNFNSLIEKKYRNLRSEHYKNLCNHNSRIQSAIAYPLKDASGKCIWVSETAITDTDHKDALAYAVIQILDSDFVACSSYTETCQKAEQHISLFNLDQKLLTDCTDKNSELFDIQKHHLANTRISDLVNMSPNAIDFVLEKINSGLINQFFFDLVNRTQSLNYNLNIFFFNIEGTAEQVWVTHVIKSNTIAISEQNHIQFSQFFEDNPMITCMFDIETKQLFALNKATYDRYGISKDKKLSDLDSTKFIGYDVIDVIDDRVKEVKEKGYINTNSLEQYTNDGELFYVDLVAFLYYFRGREMLCYSIVDVTERIQTQQVNNRLQLSLEYSPNLVLIADKNQKVNFANKTMLDKSGHTLEQMNDLDISDFVELSDPTIQQELELVFDNGITWSGDLMIKTRSGNSFLARITAAPVKENNEITGLVVVGEDLTTQLKSENEKERLRLFDTVTKLGNRNYMISQLESYFNSSKQATRLFLVLDVDNLSKINEKFGVKAGDRILKEIAKRLKNSSHNSDISRIGGDEFSVLQEMRVKDIDNYLSNLVNILNKPIAVDDKLINLSVSVGCTRLPKDAQNSSDALRNAELALLHAKQCSKNNSSYFKFTQNLLEKANQRLELEARLCQALSDNEFELYYQPKVDIKSEMIIGYEALIRWNDPVTGKLIPPMDFIPFAEETGLILDISYWVLTAACLQSASWEKQGRCAKVAINLSALQFQEADFVKRLKKTLKQTKVKPCNIELEITESMLMKNINEVLSLLHQIKKLGVTLAIDDFGTGYSSLAYLKDMPVDILKADKSFINNLPSNEKDCVIARSIISLAQDLNMRVVAEGVETSPQAQFLLEKECDYVQGFYFYKPLPASEIEKL